MAFRVTSFSIPFITIESYRVHAVIDKLLLPPYFSYPTLRATQPVTELDLSATCIEFEFDSVFYPEQQSSSLLLALNLPCRLGDIPERYRQTWIGL